MKKKDEKIFSEKIKIKKKKNTFLSLSSLPSVGLAHFAFAGKQMLGFEVENVPEKNRIYSN